MLENMKRVRKLLVPTPKGVKKSPPRVPPASAVASSLKKNRTDCKKSRKMLEENGLSKAKDEQIYGLQ